MEPSEIKSPRDGETESEDRENENEKENKADKYENKKEDIQLDDIDRSYVNETENGDNTTYTLEIVTSKNETENVDNTTDTIEIVTSKKESGNEPGSLSDNENNSTKYIVGDTVNFNINSGSTTAVQGNNSSLISSSPPTQDSSLWVRCILMQFLHIPLHLVLHIFIILYFYPAGNYMFKVQNRNSRASREICQS